MIHAYTKEINVKKAFKIRKTARIHNLATGSYLERIRFRNSSGATTVIELPPSVVSDPRLFSKRLRDAGAILPANKSSLKILLDATASSFSERELRYAAQTGWTQNRGSFVRPHGTIGKLSSTVVGFVRSDVRDPRGMIKLSGSVGGWKSTIGKAAKSSSILMFTAAAAFAAPILVIAGKTSFGFCLYAESRTGKTLATLVAGSVIGIGGSGHILDWNVTDARLQQLLAEFNDSLTPIDDLMSMRGSDRDKYARIKSLAYIMARGLGTGRHTSFSQRSNDNWTSIVLTSNEHSIRELALRSGFERDPGETVRLIDLPATFDGGTDIFDRAPELNNADEQLSWRETSFEQLFKGCELHQGRVFESFVERLISQMPQVRRDVERYTKSFVAFVHDKADGHLARDVAGKFGIVYAGGRLAIQFRLLPWKTAALRDAISKCYFASRDLLPDEGVVLRSGCQALRSYLKGLPELTAIKSAEFSSADGFQQRRPRHYRCVLKREKFNAIFASNVQIRLVTKWLIGNKRVTLAKASTGAKKVKEQHFWPDGERYRSVEILWPRKLDADS
jgi:Domain of unknown function (DUF927)